MALVCGVPLLIAYVKHPIEKGAALQSAAGPASCTYGESALQGRFTLFTLK